MSHEAFSLFHHDVLIKSECFSMMIHCISEEASMRAEHILYFQQQHTLGRIFGTIKMLLSPSVAWAAVRSKAVVLSLLIFCLLLLPL